VIPEIDIWRVAHLMLKRYGDEAGRESALRAEELAEEVITTARRSGGGSPMQSGSS
jgi:bisphosphoglycerate-dependent phosphoglycerate mutase